MVGSGSWGSGTGWGVVWGGWVTHRLVGCGCVDSIMYLVSGFWMCPDMQVDHTFVVCPGVSGSVRWIVRASTVTGLGGVGFVRSCVSMWSMWLFIG